MDILPAELQLGSREDWWDPVEVFTFDAPLPLGHLLLVICQHRVIEDKVVLALELLEHVETSASVENIGVRNAGPPCHFVYARLLTIALVQEIADNRLCPVRTITQEAQI